MRNNYSENYNDGYYHVGKDIEAFPDAWCIVVWSPRGSGKTYSGLWYSYGHEIKIVYTKRTVEDVNLILSCDDKGGKLDLSPYKPINRDKGTAIYPVKVQDGLGAFYNCPEGEPIGDPVSMILPLNKIKTVKGFDASEFDWLLVDEFIPQIGERTSAGNKEGELLLDLYMTMSRDRTARGKGDLKLVLFANAEAISTPITNTLDIVDDMAEMQFNNESIRYLNERGILLHHITEDEFAIGTSHQRSGIYRAMKNTSWGAKTFDGDFASNDFTNVKHVSLKNRKCLLEVKHKTHTYYIYLSDSGEYYMTTSQNKAVLTYDLNLENDQKLFFDTWYFKLRDATMNGLMKYQKYSMYDLIINFKKFFKL